MSYRPQHGTPLPAPFMRGNRVEIGVRPIVRAHYKDQMAELKAHVLSPRLNRIGPLGRIAGEALRRRGVKR
jgi:hypothetical protein